MKKLLLLISVFTLDIIGTAENQPILAKIKSTLDAKKAKLVMAGAIVGSFTIGAGSFVLLRYGLKQCNKKQSNKDEQDQSQNQDQNDIEMENNELSNLQNDKSISNNTDNSLLANAITSPPVASWQVNEDLTKQAPENLKEHWKVLELDQDGKKSFCIKVFEKSNNDKKVIYQKQVEQENIFSFFTKNKSISQALNNTTEQKPLTIFIKYYKGLDDDIERDCIWQLKPKIMHL